MLGKKQKMKGKTLIQYVLLCALMTLIIMAGVVALGLSVSTQLAGRLDSVLIREGEAPSKLAAPVAIFTSGGRGEIAAEQVREP